MRISLKHRNSNERKLSKQTCLKHIDDLIGYFLGPNIYSTYLNLKNEQKNYIEEFSEETSRSFLLAKMATILAAEGLGKVIAYAPFF